MKIEKTVSRRLAEAALCGLVLLALVVAAACGAKQDSTEAKNTEQEAAQTPAETATAGAASAEAAAPAAAAAEHSSGAELTSNKQAASSGAYGDSSKGKDGHPPAGSSMQMPAKPAAPAAAAEPIFEMVRVPEGKNLTVVLNDALSTKTGMVGDTFSATVKKDIQTRDHPEVIIPAGSVVSGQIVEVHKAKELKGQAKLVVKFQELKLPSGKTLSIVASLAAEGKDTSKRSAGAIAGGAAAGAILGKIIGKDTKGAAIGAVAGAAIGTGVVLGMNNQDIELPAGTDLMLNVDQEFEVPVVKPNA